MKIGGLNRFSLSDFAEGRLIQDKDKGFGHNR